jgi:hypothetical protein
MTSTPAMIQLEPDEQQKLDLLRSAATELWIGPESDDPLVQVAFHAVLQWLRGQASTPRAVLATFSQPHGPLGTQLGFVGSLLHDPEKPQPTEPPRVWWWVVKAAYYRRWQELTDPRWGRRRRAARLNT